MTTASRGATVPSDDSWECPMDLVRANHSCMHTYPPRSRRLTTTALLLLATVLLAACAPAAPVKTLPGVEVRDVKVELRDDGTNRRARLGCSYAKGSGPATVFVKAADPEHTAVNAGTGGVFNEPRLFAS